jgi:hypothetical protein
MPSPSTHLVFTGLPKSANVFIRSSLQKTLDLEWHDIYPRGITARDINARALERFLAAPRATTGQHFPATEWNLNLLKSAGVERIGVLVRDPRDAVVSWWHHMERQDIGWSDRAELTAAGIISPNYVDMAKEDKLTLLIANLFPFFQDWLREWSTVIESDKRFKFHLLRYEDFITDPEKHVTALLHFFGHDIKPILPKVEATNGIDKTTHFRRGAAGSHRDEMTPTQQRLARNLLDPALFEHFGWPTDFMGSVGARTQSAHSNIVTAAYELYRIRNAVTLEWFMDTFVQKKDQRNVVWGREGRVTIYIDVENRSITYDDYPDGKWTARY